MTSSSEQPQEYIVTEKQVTQIQYEYPFTARDIRSRPHPTPAPCPQHQIWQHCPVAGEIARKAREEIFSTLDKWFKEHDCWKSEHGNYWAPVPFPASSLMQLIDSLRSATPQSEQEEQPR